MPHNVHAILERFSGQRVLVLGDVILDRYWWGEASRLSPEAPVPVVRRQGQTVKPGGAGNTAANLAALGANVELYGIVGADREAGELKAVLADCGVGSAGLLSANGRPTTSKTRVIATHQQIVRVDDEVTEPIARDLTWRIASAIRESVRGAAALLVSDYAKGIATPELMGDVIACANACSVPVLIDPKGSDYARYIGAYLLKPNRLELGVLTRMPVRTHTDTTTAAFRLSAEMPGTHMLVTEGAEGMTLFADQKVIERVRSAPRQVFDVTGAGDTVLATLAMSLAAGASWRDAMDLASEAAGIAIGRIGTAAVSLEELRAAVSGRQRDVIAG